MATPVLHDKFSIAPVASLKPYPGNSRTHDPEQLEALGRSLLEFGFTAPVLVDEGNVNLSGHGRVEAAKKAAMVSVPIVRIEGLSEAQKAAYVIADNRLPLMAGWDDEKLRQELDALVAQGYSAEITGFSLEEIDALLSGASEPESSAPAPKEASNLGRKYIVEISCVSESDQESVLSECEAHGWAVKAMVL